MKEALLQRDMWLLVVFLLSIVIYATRWWYARWKIKKKEQINAGILDAKEIKKEQSNYKKD